MSGTVTFDRLFAQAVPLIRRGMHQRETPPVDGGRWPVSIVLRPDHPSATGLDTLMTEVEVYAGPGHFRTGIAGSVHFTVRVLERYRTAAGEQDAAVGRYADAMARGADQLGGSASQGRPGTRDDGHRRAGPVPLRGRSFRAADTSRSSGQHPDSQLVALDTWQSAADR